MKQFIESKTFKIAAIITGALLVSTISFMGGVKVGLRIGRFSKAFGRNYERNFAPPPSGLFMKMRGPEGPEFRRGYGVAGEVISTSSTKLVIKDPFNRENIVSVSKKTIIKDRDKDIGLKDIKKGDRVVILGEPSDKGIVKADLIRIMRED